MLTKAVALFYLVIAIIVCVLYFAHTLAFEPAAIILLGDIAASQALVAQ